MRNKTLKAKSKVAQLGEMLISGDLTVNDLVAAAQMEKAMNRASCIEGLDFATRRNPRLVDKTTLIFLHTALKEDESKIKWEAARVIGNIAGLFPGEFNDILPALFANAKHEGTVVRWATAYALGEILKAMKPADTDLATHLKHLGNNEPDDGVKKKYLEALKKMGK